VSDLTDAQKVFAWIQDKQRQGYTIVALLPEDMRVLETHPDLNGPREALGSMLEPPARQEGAP
jgi:hypothetical protein